MISITNIHSLFHYLRFEKRDKAAADRLNGFCQNLVQLSAPELAPDAKKVLTLTVIKDLNEISKTVKHYQADREEPSSANEMEVDLSHFRSLRVELAREITEETTNLDKLKGLLSRVSKVVREQFKGPDQELMKMAANHQLQVQFAASCKGLTGLYAMSLRGDEFGEIGEEIKNFQRLILGIIDSFTGEETREKGLISLRLLNTFVAKNRELLLASSPDHETQNLIRQIGSLQGETIPDFYESFKEALLTRCGIFSGKKRDEIKSSDVLGFIQKYLIKNAYFTQIYSRKANLESTSKKQLSSFEQIHLAKQHIEKHRDIINSFYLKHKLPRFDYSVERDSRGVLQIEFMADLNQEKMIIRCVDSLIDAQKRALIQGLHLGTDHAKLIETSEIAHEIVLFGIKHGIFSPEHCVELFEHKPYRLNPNRKEMKDAILSEMNKLDLRQLSEKTKSAMAKLLQLTKGDMSCGTEEKKQGKR